MESMPLLSTAYLPSVCYMSVLARHDRVAIEQKETFPKQTFRNRCVIATGNGPQVLSVPVVRPQGNHTRTEEILISYQEPWNVRHWRSIVSAYNAAPYFLYYRDGLENLLLHPHRRLADLNNALLQFLLTKICIACTTIPTDDFQPPEGQDNDLRQHLTSKSPIVPTPLPRYSQVFESRFGFLPNLSAIDLLFNLGPEAEAYLRSLPPVSAHPLA